MEVYKDNDEPMVRYLGQRPINLYRHWEDAFRTEVTGNLVIDEEMVKVKVEDNVVESENKL